MSHVGRRLELPQSLVTTLFFTPAPDAGVGPLWPPSGPVVAAKRFTEVPSSSPTTSPASLIYGLCRRHLSPLANYRHRRQALAVSPRRHRHLNRKQRTALVLLAGSR
jgi:hypothetical protein